MTAVLSDSSVADNELKEQLDGLGLGSHFEVVLTSANLGTVKPARENYEAAAMALGVAADQCAMVSSQFADLCGARRSGWRTVAYGLQKGPEIDAHVGHISQLIDVVCRWTCQPLQAAS
jgi:FMN phosphatase YigB (HAD superfamily)